MTQSERRRLARNRQPRVPFTPPSADRRGPAAIQAVRARHVAGSLRTTPRLRTSPATPQPEGDQSEDDALPPTPPNIADDDEMGSVSKFLRFLASPLGKATAAALMAASSSPVRTTRSFEDVLQKVLEPNNDAVADLDLATVITAPAKELLMQLLRDYRVDNFTAEALSYDGQLEGISKALQALNPVPGGPTVAQLEGAVAKQPPAVAKTKTVEELLDACLFPTKELTLQSIASPEHARVIETIVRAARAKLPCDLRLCTPELTKNLAYDELNALAPGYNAPTLAQLTAAIVPGKPPSKSLRRAGTDVDHLLSFDPQVRAVCEGALDDVDGSEDADTQPPKHITITITKQVAFAISAALHRRTSESQMKAWGLAKNLNRQTLAAQVFGPKGNSLGAFTPGLMRCVKDAVRAFKNCPSLREHLEALYEHYKNEMGVYDELVGHLDWDKGVLCFPPNKYEDVILIHLEICTGYLTDTQRSQTKSWGENHQTLDADYTEWSELPPATFDTVNCALKARNVFSTPLEYTGKRGRILLAPAPAAPAHAAPAYAAPAYAAPAPAAPARAPAARAPTHTAALATVAAPKPPKGNIAVPGVASVPWAEVVNKRLCANCYSAAHASPACTVPCRKMCCHPPWLTRFDGHARKDCKAR